jgi:UDP:flavonoid glycosyltransferase YjiC (YdhE family)
MTYWMVALGSGGDVYPQIAIGTALRRRGHRVAVISSAHFEASVRRAGLEFTSCGTADRARETLENPDLFKFGRGFRVLFDEILKVTPEVYRIIAANYVPGETVLIGGFAAFGARLAQEKLGVPMASIHLQPVFLRSLNEQPGVTTSDRVKPLVRGFRRLLLPALDRWVFDPVLAPELNRIRAELGLPPVRRVMNGWIHSPRLVIGLFPDWFAARQPDWPGNTVLIGFPVLDDGQEMNPELQQFLREGTPPVVFTAGTAMLFARKFFESAVEICRIAGLRGLLMTEFAEQLPRDLPATIRHFRYAPFTELLPRAAALVHHGGIGTVAHAFAAGLPQLITPFNFDQPDNASRVHRLGAGAFIRQRQFEAKGAARTLQALLESKHVREACAGIAARMRKSDPIGEACLLIEGLSSTTAGTAAV